MTSSPGNRATPPAESNELNEPEQPKPLEVYVTRFDKETVLLAINHPSTRRVVVGIAALAQRDEGLAEVPGLTDIVTERQLPEFRAAITEGARPNEKYKVRPVPLEGTSFSLTDIDKKFRDYLRSATANPSDDLEVWDVSSSPKDEFRIVFLGNLVLVKSAQVATAQSRAENAIVQLLTIVNENKGSRKVSLQAGCVGAASSIQGVLQRPSSEEARKHLRNFLPGKISRSSEIANEYSVTNSGWVSRTLHLDIKPGPTVDSYFKVTALVGQKEEPILNQRLLELPPCEVTQISIKPQQWYHEFPTQVTFDFNETETKLSAVVPEVRLSMYPIFVGLAFIGGVGFVIWLLWTFILKQPGPNRSWGSTIGPHAAGVVRDQKVYVPANRPWWKFWAKAKQGDESLPEPTAEYLQRRLEQYIARHDEFVTEIRAALPRLASVDQTLAELAGLQRQLSAEQAEHTRWQHLLKDVGDSPEVIVKVWSTLKEHEQKVSKQVFEIDALVGEAAVSDGKKNDVFQSLKKLHQEVPRLKQYEKAAVQIGEVVNCHKSETAIQAGASLAVDTVKKLRSFADSVLFKFAEPLQVDGESFQFSDQSLAENQKRFASLLKARETLVGLEKDERIHLARLVSIRLEKAGKLLDKIDKTNAEYGRLFTGTGMELPTLARQLQEASLALNSTLTRVSSRQVRNDGDKTFGDLNIDGVLSAFMMKLLSDNYGPLRDMLRLYQVLNIYCRNSNDPVASRLLVDSEEFCRKCEQVLSNFESLGIHFHKIRFLENPKDRGFIYTEAASVPRLQNNRGLFNLIQNRDQYSNTVADVAAWGFECELDPQRNLKTELWLWRSESIGASESRPDMPT